MKFLSKIQVQQTIDHWCRALGISDTVFVESVSRSQCMDESGRTGCVIVGVVREKDRVVIYHTRTLTEHDIVHELLHVAHPEWSESEVVAETDRLAGREDMPAAA